MKKKYGIQDPHHPFHAFANKENKRPHKGPSHKPSTKKEVRGGRVLKDESLEGIRTKKTSALSRPGHNSSFPHDALENKPFREQETIPLNKYLSQTGLCSRRKAVDYIKSGEIKVNGHIITEPGFKVTGKEGIYLRDKKLFVKIRPVYILLNKPKGYITTTDDPRDRKTVMDLIAHATTERVYPVGRLDRNTTGLLLLTNDGDLAQQLAHPGYEVKKLYHVTLDRPLTKHDFEHIGHGVELKDGFAKADVLAYEDEKDKTQIGIEIHIGRNRIVRRIFEHLGYEVKSLDRVLYAGLTKKNLPRGKWRMLTPREVILLKHFNKKK